MSQLPSVTTDSPHTRLAQLGLQLPEMPSSSYAYDPVVEAHGIAYVSGQIPKRDGRIAYTGAVQHDTDIPEAFAAAELCALNALAYVEQTVGLDRVIRVLKLSVYVASGPEFEDQPAVAEGASLLLRAVLGDAGRHARTALGVPRLPKNATVEIDLVLALAPVAHRTPQN